MVQFFCLDFLHMCGCCVCSTFSFFFFFFFLYGICDVFISVVMFICCYVYLLLCLCYQESLVQSIHDLQFPHVIWLLLMCCHYSFFLCCLHRFRRYEFCLDHVHLSLLCCVSTFIWLLSCDVEYVHIIQSCDVIIDFYNCWF